MVTVYTWSVGLSVCPSVRLYALILALQATRRPMSDTSSFWATKVWKLKRWFSSNDCIPVIWRENKRKSQLHVRECSIAHVPSPAGYAGTYASWQCFAGACAWFQSVRQEKRVCLKPTSAWLTSTRCAVQCCSNHLLPTDAASLCYSEKCSQDFAL